MSAKAKSNTPSEIIINGDDIKNPHIRRFLREKSQKQEREVIESKIPELLSKAGELFKREFKNVSALAKYLSPRKAKKTKSSKRAKALTDDDKRQIREAKRSGKTANEIVKEFGYSKSQVNKITA